jgi:hypothetical protein
MGYLQYLEITKAKWDKKWGYWKNPGNHIWNTNTKYWGTENIIGKM